MKSIVMRTWLKLVVVFSLVLISSQVYAVGNVDQLVKVKFDSNGCVSGTKRLSGSNCPTTNNPCEGVKDCICGTNNTKIMWKGRSDKVFDIQFERSDGTPFDANCKLKSKKDGSKQVVKCRVKARDAQGSYKYSIAVEHCPIYDPRIVIK